MLWLAALLILLMLVFSNRYAWWRPSVSFRHPRILMYHMIKEPVPGARFNGLRVAPAMFERQLRWLRNNGWTGYTLSELLEKRDCLPEKAVAITFDDGFEDNFLNAFPLLQKYQFKATLYLVADRHDRDWSVDKKKHHNEGELKREPKLSDAEVAELVSSGLFELGGHTRTHANFLTLTQEDKERELRDSKQDLEETFGVEVNSFAYPFGLYQPEDPELVAAAGYSSAVTTDSGIDPLGKADLLRLRRVKVSGKDNFLGFVMRMRGGKRGWKK